MNENHISKSGNDIIQYIKVGDQMLRMQMSISGVLHLTHQDDSRKVGKTRTMLLRRDHIPVLQNFLNEALLFTMKDRRAGWKKADEAEMSGTSLQGYVDVGYDKLVNAFGHPHTNGDAHKVDAEWIIKFDSGDVATIYNYKDGKNYNGESGKAVEDIRDWHIGGKVQSVVDAVRAILGISR